MCKITKFHSNTVTVTLTKLYHIKQDHFIVNFYILLEKCKNHNISTVVWHVSIKCGKLMQNVPLKCNFKKPTLPSRKSINCSILWWQRKCLWSISAVCHLGFLQLNFLNSQCTRETCAASLCYCFWKWSYCCRDIVIFLWLVLSSEM